ncbi:tyrosine-type recombinase/integrase [Sulfurovum sp. CS9]|uniref:tyrosine-type recombinase/integrase n=1 Tax=Sulfurovum sp. CS9 TaxID=3391146 RepID=UPI0039ED6AF2
MAINLKDFKATKYPNLYKSIKSHEKNGFKYLLWAKIDGKLHKKILGYSKKDNLTDRSANLKADAYKADIEAGYTSTSNITLNKLFNLYFETLDTSKQWTHKKKYIYEHYIQSHLGKKKIEKIREMDIQNILNKMTSQGLSPRTRKSVLEVLNPLFRFAVTNKYLKSSPTNGITVKIPSQKKIVTNATDLFKKVYAGITAYYHDNPYYRALFLFGFTGRRKGEILNLKWENIDFTHNYYWIEDTKTDDQQKYQLPPYLIEPLKEIKDDRKGLVFKSPITGKKIINIDRQMRQLKKFLEIDNLSMHYMRNILVSALAEQQVEAITLSGILGHKDPNTINKYLSINHYKSSQIGLDKVDSILDVEVIDG